MILALFCAIGWPHGTPVTLDPMTVVLIALGFAAGAILLFYSSRGTKTSITYQPTVREDAVPTALHDYAPRSFAAPAAKGWTRTSATIHCRFCAKPLEWQASDQVWDCACVGARTGRVS